VNAYERVEVFLHVFLKSALDCGACCFSCSGRFTHKERTSGTHCIEDWMVPRFAVVKKNISDAAGNLIPVI
jgi:hypothetical protein